MDSELVVKQILGQYKVKNLELKKIFDQVKKEIECFESFEIEHVPRSENKRADALANKAYF